MKEPLKITSNAVEVIRKIMDEKSVGNDYKLRVGIQGGSGCSGVNYLIGFDKEKEGDVEYEIEGLEVLLQKGHMMFILGTTLDYVSDGEAGGFIFLKDGQEV